jgi:hypothetical protein
MVRAGNEFGRVEFWRRLANGMNVTGYEITGLKVRSEFQLPTAIPILTDVTSNTDVTIRFCDGIGSPAKKNFSNEWIEAGDRDFLFRAKPGLAFRIREGCEISIHRAPDVADSDVNLFLIGSAWGVLCHQRGLLPLHCSAIQSATNAFAFTGPSGAGKSTLAAGLSMRGFAHLCDDVCVIDPTDDKLPIRPMPKGLKLWRDATEALGFERGAAVSSDKRLDKFYVSPAISPAPSNVGKLVRIAALYLLDETGGLPPGISKLRGGEHFLELYSSVYRTEWLPWIRDPKEVFAQIAELSAKLELFRFSRPRDMNLFDQGLDVLEAHMADMADKEIRDRCRI